MKAPKKYGQGTGSRWSSPDKEWLEHQYLVLRKSINAIHVETGAHWETVTEWLRVVGIPSQRDARHRQSSGDESPSWKGGKWWGYHKQARLAMQQLPEIPKSCAHCGIDSREFDIVVHHKDGNETNNTLENLQYLCYSCHKIVHPEKNLVSKSLALARLTQDEVLEIRRLNNTGDWTPQKLAEVFGVHPQTIRDLLRRKTWTLLEDQDQRTKGEETCS